MFEKILYPTDFSEVSKKAFDVVKQLKDAGAKEVIVVHVIDSRFFDAMAWYATKNLADIEVDLVDVVKREIDSIEEGLRETGFKVRVRIEKGVPASEILRAAKEENVSVIVIGSHGMSNIQEMLMGSVSEKVIRRSEVLVLVVKR